MKMCKKRICTRMSDYIMTPMKEVSAISKTALQRGIKRKLESNTPVEKNVEINLTPVDLRQRIKQRRKNPYELPENLDVYFNHYSAITEAIKYRYSTIVLAWRSSSVVTGDFLSTLAHKYGSIIALRDRWLPSTSCDGKMEWRGMILFYEEQKDAFEAAKDLPLQSKHVKTISMRKIVSYLADIEAAHQSCGRGSTRLIIHTDFILEEKYELQLECLLRQCGEVLCLKYRQNVCIVHFRYFTHAYLACIILDDDQQECFGKITTVVKDAEKKDYILDLLKEKVMLHVEDCYPSQ